MSDMSRESSLLSQGTLEQVMNIVNLEEIGMFLKNENVYEEPFHDNIFEMPFDVNQPDSTQRSNETAVSPISTGALPSMVDYSGPCEFDVEVSRSSDEKTKWEYSVSLKKLYVIMEKKIPFQFKWNQSEHGLYVRVLPVFLKQDSFSQAVLRCPTHASPKNCVNEGFSFVDHIIRSDHPQTLYDKNNDSKRLSILIPLEPPQAGVDWTTVIFMFMCKNSCLLGMNRRSTALIFTLERPNGEVIGRKMLKMRICSCPRRDMLKDEKDAFAAMVNKKEEGETAEVTDESEIDQKRTVSFAKKPLKRLSHGTLDLHIRLPMRYGKRVAIMIRQMVLVNKDVRELTSEEKLTLEDCNKYIQ